MSAPEHVLRAKRWLEEQLEQLGGLRNANPRDPSFKLWRQNTLTVLQRIWHGQQARSERFRQIPFSPHSPKADFATTREWYQRGCAEASEYLRALVTEVESVGVPHPSDAPAADAKPIDDDVDFPVLDLEGGAAPAAPAAEKNDIVLLDKSGTAAALSPEDVMTPGPRPGGPAPPTLRVDLRNTGLRSSRDAEGPSIPALPRRPELPKRPDSAPRANAPAARNDAPRKSASSAEPAPRAKSETPAPKRNGRAKAKRAPKPAPPRLKDMLGLQDLDKGSGSSKVMPRPTSPPASSEPASPARMMARPALPSSGKVEVKLPEPIVTSAPPATPPAPAPAPPAPVAEAPPAPPTPAPAPPASAPVAEAPPATPVAEASAASTEPPASGETPVFDPAAQQSHLDPEAFARATEDFLRSSPVLGLQGKPVQRASDATQFLDPDAVALATLASEISRHVREDAARGPLKQNLLDLAAQLEQKAPEWALLRDTVAAAMAHPELAKRLMPIVLPWLGRAA